MGNANHNNTCSGTIDPVGSVVVQSIRKMADGNDSAMGRGSRTRGVRGGLVGVRSSGEAHARSEWGMLSFEAQAQTRGSCRSDEGEGVTRRECQGSKRGRGITLGR